MPTNFNYVTPEQAFELGLVHSIERAREIAYDDAVCLCGQHVWRYGGSGMCFTCTTGESDASEDYEIGIPY
jgi:hypothetical protein